MPNSWKPEVQVGDDVKWYDNAIRFATEQEAEFYARDLFQRWSSAKAHRAAQSEDPVNYKYVGGKLVYIEGKDKVF